MEFVVWIGLAIAVGFWADSKGRSGFGWGILSLVISPLLGAIIFFFISMKDQEKVEAAKVAQEQATVVEQHRQEAEAATELRKSTITASEFSTELEKLFSLRENGLLSDDEFSQRKRDSILLLASKKPREAPTDFLSALIPLVKRTALSSEEVAEIKKYVL